MKEENSSTLPKMALNAFLLENLIELLRREVKSTITRRRADAAVYQLKPKPVFIIPAQMTEAAIQRAKNCQTPAGHRPRGP